MELVTWVLGGIGLLLLIFEVILPGGVSFSVGMSTLVLAFLFETDTVRQPVSLLITWAMLSLIFTAIGVTVARTLFGGSRDKTSFDEDTDAIGKIVAVRDTITPEGGRIFFLGSTWDARTEQGDIPAGADARICGRDNITWVVEPAIANTGESAQIFNQQSNEQTGQPNAG